MKNKNLHLVEVRPSLLRGAGNGCFAMTLLPAGTILGPFHGKHLTSEERKKVNDGTYIWKIDDNLYVDAKDFPNHNPLRYVNGAKTKSQRTKINLRMIPKNNQVFYMTIRNVLPNEELIIDYGPDFFSKKMHKTTA
jgi:hypothetical protein